MQPFLLQFLRHLNIMDYSMLLGIHDSRRGFPASMRRKNPQLQQAQGQQGSKPNGRAAAGTADRYDAQHGISVMCDAVSYVLRVVPEHDVYCFQWCV